MWSLRLSSSCTRRRLMAVLLVLGALASPAQGVLAADEKKAPPDDRIVISGASGQLGGQVIAELLARGVTPDRLILVSRTPDKLSSYAASGADVRFGDFTKPDSLVTAFAGGRQLLLISVSDLNNRVALHAAAITAARRAKIKHIVYTSFTNPVVDNPASVARDHRLTEEALASSAVPYTILRNQLYADSLIEEGAHAVAERQIVSNAFFGKWAPVTRRDCAAAAAVVLTTPGHEGRTYDITGPDLVSQRDFASLLTQITATPVRVVDMDDATYLATLLKAGVPPDVARMLTSLGVALRQSALNMKSDTLKILLGRDPESLRDLLTRNRAQLLPAAVPR